MFKILKERLENWTKSLIRDKEKKEISPDDKEDAIEDKKNIEKKQEENTKEVKEKKGLFQKLGIPNKKIKISEKDFDRYKEDLEFLLLESNVALEVSDKIIKEIKKRTLNKELSTKNIENEIKNSLKEVINEVLIPCEDILEEIKKSNKKPYVLLFCGINGSGKTTTIAKIAYYLKKNKVSSVIAAGDTFRAASIEQLKKHGENLGIKVISHEYETDPASVGFDAIKYAQKNKIDCVLIDTAGRMHTQKNLLREMEKIVKVCKPDKKIFVGESITGNDSVEQIKNFDEIIGIDNIILTKADIDERGGTALSLGYVTKKPILYLGIGQEYEDLERFDKEKFIERLGLH